MLNYNYKPTSLTDITKVLVSVSVPAIFSSEFIKNLSTLASIRKTRKKFEDNNNGNDWENTVLTQLRATIRRFARLTIWLGGIHLSTVSFF